MLIKDALLYGKKFLTDSPTAFLDTILFLKKITGLSKEKILLANDNLDDAAMEKFLFMLQQRKKNMPVQYIINQAEFMGLTFYVDQNVLIPRADTEILVENAINFITDKKLNVLDLCTGSGCISIALKKFCPHISITGLDISSNAIEIARRNANFNSVDVKFLCADVFECFNGNFARQFDIIISNPPYIPAKQILRLGENVRDYEPNLALNGGADGLDFYKFIAANIYHKCKVFFEIGSDQAQSVSQILYQNNFVGVNVVKDLAGFDRVIYADKE